jgi:hypothetical protein
MTDGNVDFWEGREPCWVMTDCSPLVYKECPAYLDRSRPCWEYRRTACAEIIPGFRDCQGCKVFRRYASEAKLDQAW